MSNKTISPVKLKEEVKPVIEEIFKGYVVEHNLIADLNGYMFKISSGVGMMDVIAITTDRRLTISRLLIETFITREGEDNGIIHSQFYHNLYKGPEELKKVLGKLYNPKNSSAKNSKA